MEDQLRLIKQVISALDLDPKFTKGYLYIRSNENWSFIQWISNMNLNKNLRKIKPNL